MADPYFLQDYIDEGVKSAGVTANDFLFVLAANSHLTVIDRDLTAPPGSIVEGAIYIPLATATGAWTGWENRIVLGHGGAWMSLIPYEGMSAWVADENCEIHWDGSAWILGRPDGKIQDSITAFATGGQTNAVALTGQLCRVSTCATAGDSVKLPNPTPGIRRFVKNSGAASCNVFAPSGKSMDGTSNGSAAVPAGKGAWFLGFDTTNWYSMIGA